MTLATRIELELFVRGTLETMVSSVGHRNRAVFDPKCLNVTAFPPKKNLVPRFRNRMELDDQIWELA
jgi:hypothetical protein